MHGIFNETLKVGHFSHCSVGRTVITPGVGELDSAL